MLPIRGRKALDYGRSYAKEKIMDYLAVFKQRSDAFRVLNALRARRIACSAVNTPSYLGLGCGVSVVFPSAYKDKAEAIIRGTRAGSFVGFYAR